eukprot:m.159868 g.159868  ORF g.159868 m.159868 type:complete len:55 (+) comp16352_c11_seq7:1201-1365(+)
MVYLNTEINKQNPNNETTPQHQPKREKGKKWKKQANKKKVEKEEDEEVTIVIPW